MAIQFLAGIQVDGHITLINQGTFKNARIQNETSDPTGAGLLGDGQIYYNSSTDKMRLRANGAWVDFTTGSDANTTYDLSGVGSTNGTAGVRLAGSDGTNDDVLVVGSGTVAVTRSGNTLTVTGTDSAVGTVTSVSGGTGITITGSATVTPTVNIDTVGTDNAIEVLVAADPVGADYVWFSDVSSSNTLRKSLISNMPGFGKDGTVTSVGSGAGLTGGTITSSGSLAVDYAGTDNVVLAAGNGASVTLTATDKVIFSDASDNNAKYANLSQVATYINAGAGSVTSVGVSGGSTGMSFSNSPITSSGTMTMSGTLDVDNGGTGLTAYTTGDILYASGTSTLAKLGIGSSGQVLKVSAGGIVEWANDTNTGLTSVGITETGNALTISNTPLTSNGNINIAGAGTASQVILGNLTLATLPVDGVTSVGSGAGLTGGTITSTGSLAIDYSATGIINDAAGMSGSAESDDEILIGDDSASGDVKKTALVDIPLNVLGVPNGNLALGSNKITGLATGTAGTDAVNLAQMQSAVAGVGVFQGGYNASTNSPALTGGSNVPLTQGDFYVVTTDGTFFTESLEVGDLIFANADIAASSTPSLSDYTVVIQDQNIAGVGATDGATEKGVAGFSSASFAGTANGFITIKAGGISDAQLASTFNKIIGTDSDINTSGVVVIDQLNMTDGVIQSHSTRTLPDATYGARGVAETATQTEVDAGTAGQQLFVSPATLKAHLEKRTYVASGPATATSSFSVAAGTHGLGTGPFITQVYNAGGYEVKVQTEYNTTSGTVDFSWTNNITANSLKFIIMKVV